jgi:hypothetical protein
MQQKTLLSSGAVTSLVRVVKDVAQMHIATKSGMLQAHAKTIAALAQGGHVQELEPVIMALENQIASLNLGPQQWITEFEQSIQRAKKHHGNGAVHEQPQRPANARPATR